MNIGKMEIPVYTNVTAEVLKSESDIVPYACKTGCVAGKMGAHNQKYVRCRCRYIYRIRTGKTLCGFVKRTVKGIVNVNVEDTASLEKALFKD